MVGARKKFRPPLWGTVGLVVVGAICISAGFWQLDRAEQKARLFATFDAAENERTLRELVSDQAAGDFRYRRFQVMGRYDAEHQVLLDNMTFGGRAGYHVLTPLRIGGRAVLVNRGWVPADPDRRIMPRIDVDGDYREITGRLSPLPRPGMRLDSQVPAGAAPWPRRLSFPTAMELTQQLGYGVNDYQLLLDRDARDGFTRDWRPALMSPNRHRGYAIQWFALAFTLFVIYLIVNWKMRDAFDERS